MNPFEGCEGQYKALIPQMLRELDEAYRQQPLIAYELAYLQVCMRVARELPEFTLAYAEINFTGVGCLLHHGMRHVLMPREKSAQ